MSDKCTLKTQSNSPSTPATNLSFPEVEFKAEDYTDLVSELNLSEAEANEFLLTLWNIMRIFAQMGLQPKDVPIDAFNSPEISGANSDNRVEIFNSISTTRKG